MPRQWRLQYPGALYHVINRGGRRESIFADDRDRRRFLEILGEACQQTGWQGHAYGLMSHPFHLKWIAARLQMGAWTSLSNAWTQQRRKEQKCQ
jgi:REP element-mobilizing transposase RayT